MFNYFPKKEKNKIDKILPWVSIIISLGGFIILYILNNNTNLTLKEISTESNKKATELKEYDLTYNEKRKSYSEIMTSLQKVLDDVSIILINVENRKKIDKSEMTKYKENVNSSLNVILSQQYNLSPFLKKSLSDSLSDLTLTFLYEARYYIEEENIKRDRLNDMNYFYTKYQPYRSFCEKRVYKELFISPISIIK